MSIGATSAAARRRVGLTVSDVSQQTRVTEPIIRGIEQDDYAECGGDFYARGHIRAIARAVGEDPVPLIDEFDSAWRSEQEITAAQAFQPSMPLAPASGAGCAGPPSWACWSWPSSASPATSSSPAWAVTRPRPAPPPPRRAATTACRRPAPRRYRAAPPKPAQGRRPRPRRPPRRARHRCRRSPRPSVAAFGPAGLANGDDPRNAALALAGRPGPALDQPVVRHRAVRGAEGRHRPAARHGPSGHRLLGARLAGRPLRRRPRTACREQARPVLAAPGGQRHERRRHRAVAAGARRRRPATCSSGSPSCPPTTQAPTGPVSTASPSRAADHPPGLRCMIARLEEAPRRAAAHRRRPGENRGEPRREVPAGDRRPEGLRRRHRRLRRNTRDRESADSAGGSVVAGRAGR